MEGVDGQERKGRREPEPGGPCKVPGEPPASGHHTGRCVESVDACEMGLHVRRLEGEGEGE